MTIPVLLVALLALAPSSSRGGAPGDEAADANAPAGQLVARLEGPSGVDVEFGPAGETILTAGAGGARVWDGRKFGR
jgi:hypothetical protein